MDLAPLSREELIAFAINLYNALVVHALVALRLTRMSTAQRATFYSRTAKYDIGETGLGAMRRCAQSACVVAVLGCGLSECGAACLLDGFASRTHSHTAHFCLPFAHLRPHSLPSLPLSCFVSRPLLLAPSQ